jgi:antitoxin component of RelBE/YafQ-DinJ toxin-antitoxin module
MKTTVEIDDALLEEAKRIARRDGITLRELIEDGLRRSIEERVTPTNFHLRRASFMGNGLRPEITSRERIRDLIYEGEPLAAKQQEN